ncbi:protein kinase [bacterium]|nr:protein kinase [bacterium]MBP9808039.1 protein kinase [bacterium]
MTTKLCKTCGKPPLANRAGSVTSYFFQHNYCQCHSKSESVSQESRSPISPVVSGDLNTGFSSDKVCANCGKSRPTSRRAGSFTAFLFKELRCNCAGLASKPVAKPDVAGRTQRRSRTAARVAQRQQFTESFRKSKVSGTSGGEFNAGTVFQPGTVIGGAFRIQSMIGQGGMGVVYLAEQISLKKQVALKILAPELVNEQSWLRFKAEAKTLAALNHSSLVKVYDLGIHENTIPYYSMDFLQGRSLEEILANDGPLPLKLALAIFIEVLDGLAYAHRNGIVHRDLKPGNIMLCTVNGARSVKILDFGISKLIGPHAASSQSLTAVGEIFGSPFYMSPEQCSGGTVDARSDIYSVGCTLIEVLTGFVPFEGEEFIETVMMHQEEPPPLLCNLSADLEPGLQYPAALDCVLAKCLAKRPQDRYQSAKEMALDLGRVIEGKEVIAPELAAVHQNQSSLLNAVDTTVQLPFLPAAAAGVVAIVVVSASAYFILRPTPTVDSAPRLRSAASADAVVSTAVLLSENTAVSAEPYDVSEQPKGSEKETFFYSNIVVEKGRFMRRFNFPVDVLIGKIVIGQNLYQQSAKGSIDVPAEESISFAPFNIVGSYPQYMKRFRPDEVTALFLSSIGCNDQVLSAVANIPGITKLHLFDSGVLTEKGFESVSRFKKLEDFALSSSNLTGECLARAKCWKTIKSLTWRGARQPEAFFLKLQGSRYLVSLNLSSNKLSHSDCLQISKLASLEHLSLANTRITIEDLDTIATLPKLTSLDLTNCALGFRAIPVLKKMKSLKELAILQPTSLPEFRKKLINQLPHVKVHPCAVGVWVPSDY